MPTTTTTPTTTTPTNPLYISRDELEHMLTNEPALYGMTLGLSGPPGTGKSSLAETLRQTYNVPIYWLSCNPDATSNDAIGGWTPNPDGSGRWQYTYGPVLRAFGLTGEPGILVVDDVHLAGPGLQSALYIALNKESAFFTTPDGVTHRPVKEYWAIYTSNEAHEALPLPIVDRTSVRLMVLQPSTAMLQALRPEIRDLVETDYDGMTVNPLATYREWRTISQLWDVVGLGRAILMALGDIKRAEKMLEALATIGIKDAATAYALVVAAKP